MGAFANFGDYPNYLTEGGAKALSQKIEQYWHKRGFDKMQAWVAENRHGVACTRTYGVRSNLLNGWPPK